MTRKDFELIAEVLSATLTTANMRGDSSDYVKAVRDIAETFSYRLRGTNPRFDTDRFLKAALNEGLLK